MAAVSAARAGAKVTVLEQNKQAGKKLLATGNGRCNLTNRDQTLSCYRGSSPEFIQTALDAFGLSQTLEFFYSLGIVIRDRDGYLYPYSDQASSVVEVLRMEAERQACAEYKGTKDSPGKGRFSGGNSRMELCGRCLDPGGRFLRSSRDRLGRKRLFLCQSPGT